MEHTRNVLVGTYTTGTTSRGIYRLSVNVDTGKLSAAELALETRDPSYLLPTPYGLFWVDEALGEKMGQLCFAPGTAAGYGKACQVPSGGVNPCHLAISPSGDWLAVANYSCGTVALFARKPDGPVPAGLFPGRHGSVRPDRQEGPHAHFVCFDGDDRLYVSDLGADEIRVLRCVSGTWTEDAQPHLRLEDGDGPRHFLRQGDAWYIITELSNRLYRISSGGKEVISLLEPGEGGTAAALRRQNDLLYCTQRGEDILVVVRETAEGLEKLGRFAVGGKTPRDCLPLGDVVLCACQDSGEVISMKREGEVWTAVDRLKMPGAVGLAEER